jgi:hypothetical protein
MENKNISACGVILVCLFFIPVSISWAQEQLTITTYYPAPYGIYLELRANQMAIGSAYRTTALGDGNFIVSGSVGIRTPTPASPLHVMSVEGLRTQDDNAFITFYRTDGAQQTGYLQMGTGATVLQNTIATPMYFRTSSANRLTILANGRVGIGTTGPAATLDVNGTMIVRMDSATTTDPMNVAPYTPQPRFRNKNDT